MADQVRVDPVSGTETTGHKWDGIEELDTPIPNWWRWILYATIVWSIGYWIAMPAWPIVSGYTKGVLGYSSRAAVAEDIKVAAAAQSQFNEKLRKASLEQVRTNSELLEFALAGGRSAFNVNCSQCHGSGAQGFKGYPNLNDDEWLWGGTLKEISFTITHGARNESDDARVSEMPAFLKDELLKENQINDVAEYVLSLSKNSEDAKAVSRGAPLFKEHCVDCHAEGGVGNKEFGAPALSNNIWLYGGDRSAIRETIANSRKGVMPAWGPLLDPDTIKKLAIYVHSLGGGK
ncbi:MAG: cytochrome-c oxidase, cbb3-type subunit III [Rhodospirillaceae bacterium]|jgi:cytochrome c oxidase cbb3-type subunit III|nr:cytochrome-c oxidase, cbb3-type subunit III [Rhodospirillaceae bacterium]MBT7955418.1 cytochrome-c oxidase, cbb3-type subunit III [Rhodospirillaceae bacterium]